MIVRVEGLPVIETRQIAIMTSYDRFRGCVPRSPPPSYYYQFHHERQHLHQLQQLDEPGGGPASFHGLQRAPAEDVAAKQRASPPTLDAGTSRRYYVKCVATLI